MPINRAKRTPAIDPDAARRAVFVLEEEYAEGAGPWHAHRRAQLIHAGRGVVTVRAEHELWVVPPQRAVWVLPGVRHQVSSRKRFLLRTLYAAPGAAALPERSGVVAVDPLVDALLAAAAQLGPDYPEGGAGARLIAVVLDRLPLLNTAPLNLPTPRDPRLRRLTDALEANPAERRTLLELSRAAGLTARTAARLFLRDTGLSFARWRQQLRLLAALEKLGAGESVTAAAFDVGYEDVSSFIAVFKAAMGDTPARYFRR